MSNSDWIPVDTTVTFEEATDVMKMVGIRIRIIKENPDLTGKEITALAKFTMKANKLGETT
jgi:hypothetical protein